MPLLFATTKLNEGGTELGNVLGWIPTNMLPLNGAWFVFGSLHRLTQQQPVWFFLDKIFAGRKVKIVKRIKTNKQNQ